MKNENEKYKYNIRTNVDEKLYNAIQKDLNSMKFLQNNTSAWARGVITKYLKEKGEL